MSGRASLRWRLVGPMLAILLVAGPAILALSFREASALTTAQMRERAEGLLTSLSYYHADETAAHPGGLQRFVTSMGAERDVVGLMVVGQTPPVILAATWREGVGRPLATLGEPPAAIAPLLSRLTGHIDGWAAIAPHRWCLTRPLSGTAQGAATPGIDGHLGIILDSRVTGAALADRFLIVGLWGCGLFIVLLALGLTLTDRLLLHPLRALIAAVQDGNRLGWKTPLPLHGPGEIGTLAVAFQQAADRLGMMRQAVDAAANGVVVLDARQPDAPIIHANPAFANLADESASDLAGHSSGFGRITGRDAQQALDQALATGEGCRINICHERPDGSSFHGELRLSPIRDGDGRVVRFIGILNDLTDLFHIQERVAESETRHRLLIEHLPEAVVIQVDGVIRFANEAAVHLMRQAGREDLEGLSLADLIHSDEPAALRTLHREQAIPPEAASPGSSTTRFTARFPGRDQPTPVEITTATVPWKGQTALCVIIRDIGERQRIENALIRSQNLTQKLFDDIPNPIWRAGIDGRLTYVNQAWMRLTGRSITRELALGRDGGIHDEDRPLAASCFATALQDQTAYTITYRLQQANGTWAWITEHGIPCRDLDGHFIGLMGSCYDITEIKQASLQYAEAHAEAELLFSTISAALLGLDTQDHITRWNAAAERMFGSPASEVLGRTLAESGIRMDWADVFLGINQCITDGRTVELHDLRYQRPDGSDGFMFLAINSSWSATGDGSHRLGVVLLATDTTERRLVESQRQQGAKLESIGQLAAGIAHEINTPIQFIGDNLHFLADANRDRTRLDQAHDQLFAACRDRAPADLVVACDALAQEVDVAFLSEETPKAIAQSLEGVERVATIVKAMKEFAHPDLGEKTPADLNHIITTTLIVARNEYKYVADLVTDLATDLPPVPCLAGEMKQVVLNLLVNASHAIGDAIKGTDRKGTITVTTRAADGWAELRIADTGTGIPEQARSRIFEPFFTTKEVGRGTGQGLYITRTVIEKKHDGTISFETELGKGTTFVIRLPLAAGGGA